MTRFILKVHLLGVGFVVCGSPCRAAAQPVKITVDSVLRALSTGDSAIDYRRLEPARHDSLVAVTKRLRELRAAELSIDDFATAASAQGNPPGFLHILRWDRARVSLLAQPALASALDLLQKVALFQSPIRHSLGLLIDSLAPANHGMYMGAMEALQIRLQLLAQAANTAKLRRFELKFGADAPRLNPVETAVNYLLERASWLPGWLPFAPNDNGPGSLEFVATYSNTDLGSSHRFRGVRIPSSAHVGFRHYRFDTTSTRSAVGKLLHPRMLAFGVSAFSPNDRPLDSPFRTGFRTGGFVDLGSLRVSGAIGKDWRAMIGTKAQLLPHLF